MPDPVQTNLNTLRLDDRQVRFWSGTVIFFEWCRQRLRDCLESLDNAEHEVSVSGKGRNGPLTAAETQWLKKQYPLDQGKITFVRTVYQEDFASGKVPERLLEVARAELSRHLKRSLPWDERYTVIKGVLKNPRDLALWMNCPLEKLDKLPKRIRTTIDHSIKKRCEENHASFFSNVSEAQMEDYCRAWRSVEIAESIVFCLARRSASIGDLDAGKNEAGKMKIGGLRVDVKKTALAEIAATGNTASRIVSFAMRDGLITSEDVIRAKKRKRRPEMGFDPIDSVPRFLVDFWCGETGGSSAVPPLCLFTHKALSDFVGIALNVNTNEQAVRKWVSRLGLVRPRRSGALKIRGVKQSAGELRFCR